MLVKNLYQYYKENRRDLEDIHKCQDSSFYFFILQVYTDYLKSIKAMTLEIFTDVYSEQLPTIYMLSGGLKSPIKYKDFIENQYEREMEIAKEYSADIAYIDLSISNKQASEKDYINMSEALLEETTIDKRKED